MKILRPLLLALALALCGCISTSPEKFQLATLAQINAKVQSNSNSDNDMFNEWRYAGSDDQYDYIYEYKEGIFVTPKSNFHYYKLPKGEYKLPCAPYPFNPDPGTNFRISVR